MISGISMRKKLRTFVQDLEACLLYVLANGFAASGKVALKAGSAGAVPVANLLFKYPQSVGAMVLDRPFLDLCSFLMNPNEQRVEQQWDEWGCPQHPEEVRLLQQICPYQVRGTALRNLTAELTRT